MLLAFRRGRWYRVLNVFATSAVPRQRYGFKRVCQNGAINNSALEFGCRVLDVGVERWLCGAAHFTPRQNSMVRLPHAAVMSASRCGRPTASSTSFISPIAMSVSVALYPRRHKGDVLRPARYCYLAACLFVPDDVGCFGACAYQPENHLVASSSSHSAYPVALTICSMT